MDYIEMNREERYFCFLLGHALLTSIAFREQFCEKIDLPSDNLEVYPEAAWLRDYWKSLDYPSGGGVGRWRLSAKGNQRQDKRMNGLVRILEIVFKGKESKELQSLMEIKEDFFWSKDLSGQGEIISPGRWPLEKLAKSPFAKDLIFLKWAFNAKPDLMLVSGKKFCLIEAKVESSEDMYSYKTINKTFEAPQTEIQGLIGKLITGLSNGRFSKAENIMLSRKEVESDKHLSWKWVVSLVEQNRSSLDSFTVEGFERSPFLRKLII